MGWTENWNAAHLPYVKANKDVKGVLEHRNVEGGEIYCVTLAGEGFEVRHYADGKLKVKTAYPSGTKAVLGYRELRDKLVPKKATPKPKAKATKSKKAAK